LIIDNDLGRHTLSTLSHGKSRRELVLVKSGHRVMTAWLRKSVEAGRTGF
jgi:hypothetical protein